jgi:hypothetical protein
MSNCKELKMAMFFYFGKSLVAKGMLTSTDPFSLETRAVPCRTGMAQTRPGLGLIKQAMARHV